MWLILVVPALFCSFLPAKLVQNGVPSSNMCEGCHGVQPDGGIRLEEKQSRNPCHMRSSKQPMVLQFQQQQHVKEPRCVHFFL